MRAPWWMVLLVTGCATYQLDESRLVDLSYSFDETTIYWPTARRFRLERTAHGVSDAGYWYASNDYSASEHGGTHMDAPLHFAEGRRSTAEIPLRQLVGHACVVDIRQQCEDDPNYLLSPEDILRHEESYGRIAPGSVVLIYTGFGRYYPHAQRYLLVFGVGKMDRCAHQCGC